MTKAKSRRTERTRWHAVVGYVDDSYWDDGNRSTSQAFAFESRRDALAFVREVRATGRVTARAAGEGRDRRFAASWVRLEESTTREREWSL